MFVLRNIRDDIRFVLDRDPAALNPLEVIFLYPGFQARELHRLAHTLWRLHVPFLPRALSHLGRFLTGIEIHPGATMHGRCFIDHGMGVVIGETAEIGDGCHLHQGVTLGGTSTQRTKRHPTLGADVTVGAGAQVIGAVTIGDGQRRSVPAPWSSANVPEPTPPWWASPATSSPTPTRAMTLSSAFPDPEHDRLDIIEQRLFELESRMSDHEYPHENGDATRSADAPAPAETPGAN